MKKIISGKVRDVYEISKEKYIIITSDRISSFDVILGSLIPNKGIILNSISNFWFDYTKDIVPNHIISNDIKDMPKEIIDKADYLNGRVVLVKKLKMLPFEFIVRGYIFGNMWYSYQKNGEFCSQKIPKGYKLAEKLITPVITPSIKNNKGHDEYISIEKVANDLGSKETKKIIDTCFNIYDRCYKYALERGIIIADTKFEFGYDENGNLTLGDEILTPDSSRFWNLSEYKIGTSPASYDKQFVRDWLIENKLDGKLPAPKLPDDIVKATEKIYLECQNKLLAL